MLKTLKLMAVLLATVSVLGCGGDSGGGGSDSDPITTSLFISWINSDDTFAFDISNGNVTGGEFQGAFAFTTGEVCTCDTTMSGSYVEGTLVTNDCSYTSGGTGDPGCATFSDSYTYSRSGDTLSVCDSADDCTDFTPAD